MRGAAGQDLVDKDHAGTAEPRLDGVHVGHGLRVGDAEAERVQAAGQVARARLARGVLRQDQPDIPAVVVVVLVWVV